MTHSSQYLGVNPALERISQKPLTLSRETNCTHRGAHVFGEALLDRPLGIREVGRHWHLIIFAVSSLFLEGAISDLSFANH